MEFFAPLGTRIGFDRKNLEFVVNPKTADPWQDLKPWMENVQNATGRVLIYVSDIPETKAIHAILAEHGIKSLTYHDDLSDADQKAIANRLYRREVNVIVATTAFLMENMGIVKSDTRLVIQYGGSENLSGYVYAICRAGIDGQPAKVVGFFDEDNFQGEDILASRSLKYIRSTECRRKALSEYFGIYPVIKSIEKNCCDNCNRNRSSNPSNSSQPAQQK